MNYTPTPTHIMTSNVAIPTTKLDPQLYHRAEQGDVQAQNKLRSLANSGWVSGMGWTPIQFAVVKGLVNVVTMLAREREQDLHAQPEDGWTLLHLAAFYGQ